MDDKTAKFFGVPEDAMKPHEGPYTYRPALKLPSLRAEAEAAIRRADEAVERFHQVVLALVGKWPYGYDIEASEPRVEGGAYVTDYRFTPRPPPREVRPEEIATDDEPTSGEQE